MRLEENLGNTPQSIHNPTSVIIKYCVDFADWISTFLNCPYNLIILYEFSKIPEELKVGSAKVNMAANLPFEVFFPTHPRATIHITNIHS